MTEDRCSCPVQWLKERGLYTSTEWLLTALKHKEGGLYICCELFRRALSPFYGLKNKTYTPVVRAYRTSYFATKDHW